MKASLETILSGLDRLYFTALADNETIELREESIRVWLQSYGISMDDIIQHLLNESVSS